MKQQTLIRLIVVMIFVFLAIPAMAQTSDNEDSDASATIIDGIAIIKSTDLQFGSILPSSNAGYIKLITNGDQVDYSNIIAVSGSNPTQASFQITGQSTAAYTVTLPDNVTLLHTGGLYNMYADEFNYTTTNNGTGSPALDAEGHDGLDVGAKLHVGANQNAGLYIGSFSVTVAYQ